MKGSGWRETSSWIKGTEAMASFGVSFSRFSIWMLQELQNNASNHADKESEEVAE